MVQRLLHLQIQTLFKPDKDVYAVMLLNTTGQGHYELLCYDFNASTSSTYKKIRFFISIIQFH